MTNGSRRQASIPKRPARAAARKKTIGWPIILSGIAAVVVGVAGVVALALTGGGESRNALATQIEASARRLPQRSAFTLGSSSAPLELEVFEDFQCPYCIRFTAEIEPALIDEYVSTGKVRLVFRNYPILGRESEAAASASVCAAKQNHAWEYSLALFAAQANAGQVERERIDAGRFDRDDLLEIGTRVGLREEEFATCFGSAEASASVKEQSARGTSLGVRGTPGFALGGVLVTRVPSDIGGWRSLLDERLASAARTPAAP